jgi:hypothetical protein
LPHEVRQLALRAKSTQALTFAVHRKSEKQSFSLKKSERIFKLKGYKKHRFLSGISIVTVYHVIGNLSSRFYDEFFKKILDNCIFI